MYKINCITPKIRDLRALAKRYNKITGAKRRLYFKAKSDMLSDSGWWFDSDRPMGKWHLGYHVSDAFPVLDENLAEYEMSVGNGER